VWKHEHVCGNTNMCAETATSVCAVCRSIHTDEPIVAYSVYLIHHYIITAVAHALFAAAGRRRKFGGNVWNPSTSDDLQLLLCCDLQTNI